MNRVELSGRLTRDAELRFVGARDWPILTLNLGVEDGEGRWNSETKKVEVNSGFYRVEIAGEIARTLGGLLTKGDPVYVVGSLQQFSFGGKDGGERQTRTQVKAVLIQPLNLVGGGLASEGIDPPDSPPTENWDEEPF